MTHEETEVVESQAEDILHKTKEWISASVEVTEAFSKAVTIPHQLVSSPFPLLLIVPEVIFGVRGYQSLVDSEFSPRCCRWCRCLENVSLL